MALRASIRRRTPAGQAADALRGERMGVVSDSPVIGKLMIMRLRKSPLNLKVNEFSLY